MRRRELIRHIESQGCEFLREGGIIQYMSIGEKGRYLLSLAIKKSIRIYQAKFAKILGYRNPSKRLWGK